MSTKNIEEKQYLLRFRADTKSHLTVMDNDICMTKCPDKICTIFCPAEVYKWEGLGCRLDMKAVMNAEAAGLAVRTKILNGNIQKADMELSSD